MLEQRRRRPMHTDMLALRPSASRSRRVLAHLLGLLLMIGIGSATASFFVHLQSRAAVAHEQERRALESVSLLHAIDAQEWRAAAGEDLDEVRANVQRATADLFKKVAPGWDSVDSPRLQQTADTYLDAVHDELDAWESGDAAVAREIDETRADPGFAAAINVATGLADEQGRRAADVRRSEHWLTWVTTLGTVLMLGGLGAGLLATRERRRDRRQQHAASRRFRSLVEGSPDVITVVSGADDLTVMSASLGALGGFAAVADPQTVRDLLPGDAFDVWRAVDERLRVEGGHVQRELTVERGQDSRLWLEIDGSPLVDSPSERVWVWRDITYRKELELQLTHQAFHDALTGVANRSLLCDRTDHAISLSARSGAPISLLFCDLDDFKTVNDTLGHALGDELLNLITTRIGRCVRDGDTIARLGGDEFAVLLEDADTNTAVALAERILREVTVEATIGEQTFFPSMSIGVATAVPGLTTDELLRNADLAMYSAKHSGKCRVTVFQERMHERTSELLQLQTDLKAAIAGGDLCLHYQPTIDLESGTVEGVEALLRWVHPTLGNIPPDQFIPIAEATGMIIAIGRWVLREACRAAVTLGAGHAGPLLMHVNVAPQQLLDPTFVDEVKQALAETGLSPAMLVLEVTEGVLLDSAVGIQRLHEINALGVMIAIDDFGTGYTSINYLQRLPVKILKIDRSFISGSALAVEERNAFLQAIVGLAKGLSFRTVAEGIEDVAQLAELKGLGCDAGQGWLWAKATPLAATLAAIEQIEGAVANGDAKVA